MSKELTTISPEGLEIAQAYLQFGNIKAVTELLHVPEEKVVAVIARREVKKYIDEVYLDAGFRNRNNIASVMDEIIECKLEEARESQVFSNKDLVDLMQIVHKMRMDEINAQAKADASSTNIKNQQNIQVNSQPFAQGNYGSLIKDLLKDDNR
jgi:hypothetical protein